MSDPEFVPFITCVLASPDDALAARGNLGRVQLSATFSQDPEHLAKASHLIRYLHRKLTRSSRIAADRISEYQLHLGVDNWFRLLPDGSYPDHQPGLWAGATGPATLPASGSAVGRAPI